MSDNHNTNIEKPIINKVISLINVIINEILGIINKPHRSENSEMQSILNCLNNHNVTSQEFYNWLLNDRNNSNYIIILADFHFLGIGISVNKQKAFELFQEAANLGNAFGIFMIGYCYHYGTGTMVDVQKAFELFQEAADLGDAFGMDYLRYCYQHGIGTSVNEQRAFESYQNAANLDHISGILS